MDADTAIGGENARFPSTLYSAVAAIASDQPERRRPGHEAIAAAYWKPVYRYIRVRFRRSNEDAKDLTQSFFAASIEKLFFQGYDPQKGTFRTYLRTCLDRFLANDYKFGSRQKRAAELVPLDFDAAGPESPADTFDQEWRRSLFEDAVEKLRDTLHERGRDACFVVFERYDLAEEPASYDLLARDLGLSRATVTNYLAAARRDLRRLVLERLRDVTTSDSELRRETKALFR